MKELWKKIEEFPNYSVSNLGNVRNDITSKRKAQTISRGYYYTTLCNNKKNRNCSIHRLVASAFLNNKSNCPCVNHIDGNKINNNLSNLEWCTYTENAQHAIKNNLRKNKTGHESKNSKYTKEQVSYIFELRKNGLKMREISDTLKIPKSTITHILLGSRWPDFL